MKKLFILALGVALYACSKAVVIAPSQSDVDRVQVKYPNYSMDQLLKGKQIYEANCQTCHGLKNPAAESEEEWNKIVPRMTKKVNKSETKMTAEDQELVLRYLVTMSGHGK